MQNIYKHECEHCIVYMGTSSTPVHFPTDGFNSIIDNLVQRNESKSAKEISQKTTVIFVNVDFQGFFLSDLSGFSKLEVSGSISILLHSCLNVPKELDCGASESLNSRYSLTEEGASYLKQVNDHFGYLVDDIGVATVKTLQNMLPRLPCTPSARSAHPHTSPDAPQALLTGLGVKQSAGKALGKDTPQSSGNQYDWQKAGYVFCMIDALILLIAFAALCDHVGAVSLLENIYGLFSPPNTIMPAHFPINLMLITSFLMVVYVYFYHQLCSNQKDQLGTVMQENAQVSSCCVSYGLKHCHPAALNDTRSSTQLSSQGRLSTDSG